MTKTGPAKRLLISIFSGDAWHDQPLYAALIDMLRRKGLTGATVTRASAGFPDHGESWKEHLVDLAAPETVRIEVVDRADLIDAVVPDVRHMVERGLVEVQETNVIKTWQIAEPPREDASLPVVRTTGTARELHIQLGEADRWEGEPLYAAIVKRAQQFGIAGVSVFRGILGYGAHGTLHRHKALALRHDDPMLVVVVDSPDHVDQLVAAIDGMIADTCLLTIHDVAVIRYARPAPASEPTHG